MKTVVGAWAALLMGAERRWLMGVGSVWSGSGTGIGIGTGIGPGTFFSSGVVVSFGSISPDRGCGCRLWKWMWMWMWDVVLSLSCHGLCAGGWNSRDTGADARLWSALVCSTLTHPAYPLFSSLIQAQTESEQLNN
jgi:hypothetical protein